MPDKKPKTTVEPVAAAKQRAAEAGTKTTSAPATSAPTVSASATSAQADAGEGTGTKTGGFTSVRANVGSWIRHNFPGHENAFIGGACGLLAILLIYTIGLGKTLLIALFLVGGIAIGLIFDGDPKIIRAIRHLIEARNQ